MRLTPGMLSHGHRPAPTAENYRVHNVNQAALAKPRRGGKEEVSGAIRAAYFLPEKKKKSTALRWETLKKGAERGGFLLFKTFGPGRRLWGRERIRWKLHRPGK